MTHQSKITLGLIGTVVFLAFTFAGFAQAKTTLTDTDNTFAKCSKQMGSANIQTCCTTWLRTHQNRKLRSQAASVCSQGTQGYNSKSQTFTSQVQPAKPARPIKP